MTTRESMQVSVILAFIAAGFAFHFAFNDGLKTESSSPASAATPAISKKLERARALQQAAIRLNQQRFVALKERKAQRARVARARARARTALAAAGVSSSSSARSTASTAPRASSPAPVPTRSAPAPVRRSPAPKPATSGGGGGFDDSG